jgi:glutathione S-transferase
MPHVTVSVIRVYRIPLSTNVERVALAAGLKGVDVDWVDVDPSDRSPVRAVSGQGLVPVLVADGEIVFDSPRVIAWLEDRHPDPALWPRDPARRAEADVFVEWFNRVWKGPPNEIAAELEKPAPDMVLVEELGGQMVAWLDLFEGLLSGRDFLLGELGVADVVAFPFLKYGVFGLPEGDDELFHRVLVDRLPIGQAHPRLAAWVERVDALPRA